MNPDSVTVLIGQSIVLVCRAVGTDIVYQWIKDNRMVIGSKSRKLKFTNIEESNEGAYMCRASNKGGMVTSNPGTVTVYGELAIAKCKLQLASYLTI